MARPLGKPGGFLVGRLTFVLSVGTFPLGEPMEESTEPYVRRYPDLPIEAEYHFVEAARLAQQFGRTYLLHPDGVIREREGMDDRREWEIRQEAARKNPYPPQFRHLDEWTDEPPPLRRAAIVIDVAETTVLTLTTTRAPTIAQRLASALRAFVRLFRS